MATVLEMSPGSVQPEPEDFHPTRQGPNVGGGPAAAAAAAAAVASVDESVVFFLKLVLCTSHVADQ